MPHAVIAPGQRRSGLTLALQAAILLSWATAARAQDAPRYTMQVIEPRLLDAAHDVRVQAIDKQGNMIGTVETPPTFSGDWYRWNGGGAGLQITLKTTLDFYWASAAAINEAGLIAFTSLASHAVGAWASATVAKPSGRMRAIEPRGSQRASYAMGLNEAGTVVGWTELARSGISKTFGFIWSEEGGWREYDGPGDGKSRIHFTGINDAGTVIGQNTQYPTRAFTFTEQGGFKRIAGAQTANAIDSAGRVVGAGSQGAYLYDPLAGVRTLPALPGAQESCVAHDINAQGVIVGSCFLPANGGGFVERGVLWWPLAGSYAVRELDALVEGPRPAGHWVERGWRINDVGTIVVRLREAGQPWNVEHSGTLQPLDTEATGARVGGP